MTSQKSGPVRNLSTFEKIEIQVTCQEVRRQQNMEPQYFFIFCPLLSSILKSQTATGLNMTDNYRTFFAYIPLLPTFWCYKDMTKCGYSSSFTGIFGFQFNSCWTGAFYYCHTQSTQKPRSNCCRNRILFSYSYQDWSTHTWQEEHANAYCKLRKAQFTTVICIIMSLNSPTD